MAYWRGSEIPLAKEKEWVSQVGMRERHDTLEGIAFSDLAGTVNVDQSSDGTHWDFTEAFSVVANTGKSWNVALVAPFWRLRYKNTSTTETSSVFRISASTQAGGDS